MNNTLPKLEFIYDRYKKATEEKPGTVELRITHNYKQKWLSTGIRLLPHQWKNGKILNSPNLIQISQMLDKLLTDVRQVIIDMMNEGYIDIFSIPKRLEAKHQKDISFLEYCKMRATIRKYGKKKDTQERYDRFLRLFSDWGKIVSFSDVTDENIILYDKYLSSKGMKPYSKWNNYHRFVDSFILDAIAEGYLRRNPYKWLNIPKDQESLGLERCLTPEELKQIETAIMPSEALERVRNIFIFQTYTCLRYSDLKKFDASKITMIKGTPVYIRNSVKTNKSFTIPLLPPAIKVLNKYNNKLPVISNPKYNLYLKIVAQAAGVNKPISTHWARHTGATMLLNKGAEMKIITKVCGHSSTRITEQVYAKLLNETVVDAIQEIKEKLE